MASEADWRSPDLEIKVGVSACLSSGSNHHVAPFDLAYVRDQVYLRPHPKELMLRNHV